MITKRVFRRFTAFSTSTAPERWLKYTKRRSGFWHSGEIFWRYHFYIFGALVLMLGPRLVQLYMVQSYSSMATVYISIAILASIELYSCKWFYSVVQSEPKPKITRALKSQLVSTPRKWKQCKKLSPLQNVLNCEEQQQIKIIFSLDQNTFISSEFSNKLLCYYLNFKCNF